jgi:hypothetical protein
MSNINIDFTNKRIILPIPLTTTSGKIRVKNRSTVFEYGLPHASKQQLFSQSNYIEWQIGYDVIVDDNEKLQLTSLPESRFIAYNGKTKALYELSEFIYYFLQFNIITRIELEKTYDFLKNIDGNYVEKNYTIKRSHPCEELLNNVTFYKSIVEYPLLVHKFEHYEIVAEIIIREKQRAVGTQAMLYLCFPITELQAQPPLLGRAAQTKEFGNFTLDKNNYKIILEMTKIFGMLSQSHNTDIIAILSLILSSK